MNLSLLVGPQPIVLAIGIATGLATALGGVLALRLKSRLDLLMAFGAGAVLGVSLFDLLPEALKLGAATWGAGGVVAALAGGFTAYLLINRAVSAAEERAWRGHLGPAALTAHSFMDGLGIGLAFHVSPSAGALVTAAVLAHDLLDGANTVTLALAAGTGGVAACGWLAADALAPLTGIVVAGRIAMPQATLAILLAVFAGFFLYIGGTDLLPHALRRRPLASTPIATFMGLVLLYAVVRFSGG